MSDQDRRQAQPEQGQEGGVFGKLPSARPGVRSPRRRAEGTRERKAPGAAAGQVGDEAPERRDPATGAPGVRPPDTTGHGSPTSPPTQPRDPRERPEAPSSPTQPEAAREPEATHGGDAPGVEDLAWAGVTVAAEAATLGVRLLSRAIEAVRKPADHR